MKKLFLSVIALFFAAFVTAQNVDKKTVPAIVTSNFSSKFPKAENEKWEKEKGNYEASFIQNKVKQYALIDKSGNLIQTEVEIKKDLLPKNVTVYLAAHYPTQKIKEVSKITTASGLITFEIEIKGKELIFDTNGTFIKESIE